MSTIQGLPVKLSLDKRIKPCENLSYTVLKGPSKSVYTPYPSQAYSNSSLQIQVIPPAANVYLSRVALIKCEVDFTLTAVNPLATIFPSGNPGESGVVSLRYLPLHNVANNFQAQINGFPLSYTSNEIIPPLSNYNTPTPFLEEFNWSTTPSCKEPGCEYQNTYGTNRSSMSPQFSNVAQDSNATTANFDLISTAPGTATIRARWIEPILYPPFSDGLVENCGLLGLNSALIFNWTFQSLERMLAYDNFYGENLSNIQATWASAPVLVLNWLNSPAMPIDISGLHLAHKYPYSNYQILQNPVVTIPSGGVQTISLNNMQLSGIPRSIYVFCRQQLADRTPFENDFYAVTENISIQFGQLQGILSSANPFDLYHLCVRNGLKMRYSDFYSTQEPTSSAPLKLEFDRDIPLDVGLAVGIAGTFQLLINLRVRNQHSQTITYTPFVIAEYEGIFSILDGNAMTSINMVQPSDVLYGAELSEVSNLEETLHDMNKDTIAGGNILTSAKNYIKQGQHFYNAHKDTIHKVLETGRQIGTSAATLLPVLMGLGLDYGEAADLLQGAGLTGGGLTGGKLISNPRRLLTGKNTSSTMNRRY